VSGEELTLFPGGGGGSEGVPLPGAVPSGGAVPSAAAPLAARMRPRSLEEVRGQEELLGPGRPLRRILEGEPPGSMILWGPPGSGKTTLARLLAERADVTFVAFSAVTEGVARVREIIKEAGERLRATGRRTILFCDEIHRFNRAQQDAFLPHVEDGTVILVGATTENPSFEVVRPLLSRAPVYVLQPLDAVALRSILQEALADRERGLGELELVVAPEALDFLAGSADGDARRALGALEAAARLAGAGGRVGKGEASQALQLRYAVYDRSGEEHFNLISALHKAVRGSDPDGALYWLARMLHGGEDPRYIGRRLVRMASEDIGLADPRALEVTLAARDAYLFLGSPEGELALAEATVYLATAPKSNRIYAAWAAARARARETPSAPVPLHIRNAPTGLMEELGYGSGYRYDPDQEEGVSRQEYLPEELRGEEYYLPGPRGFEEILARRLAWFRARRRGESGSGDGDGSPGPFPG